MLGRCSIVVLLLFLSASEITAQEDVAALLKDLGAVKAQGAGSPAARAAWDKLVARGPAAVLPILQAMDTNDTVVSNWLRTALDQIVETEMKSGGKKIDGEALVLFAKDSKRQGRARRLALEVAERRTPGVTADLVRGMLDDPEFRYEAIEAKLKEAEQLVQKGQKEKAVAEYRLAFAAARDLEQARIVAAKLKDQGITVSVADHFGFLREWYVIGPFDGKEMAGFKTAYPPEEKIDLSGTLTGKEGKVSWKRYEIKEATAGLPARVALVNLPEVIGHAEDAVAYAYTAITVPQAQEVEFRGAADDNFAVWVNGKRVFGFEEYRNGVRLDRHRFKVQLREGVNTILVKVCQAPLDPTNKEPNWEFLLRVVDGSGKGLTIKSALPPQK